MSQYFRKLKKGIRWYYKFDLNRKTYFSKCIYVSKIEAMQAENEYRKIIYSSKNTLFSKSKITLNEVINNRLSEIKNKRTRNYYYDNKRYFSILIDTLGDIPIEHIKRADIYKILLTVSNRQKIKGRKNNVVNYILSIYKALFNYCIIKFNLDINNPCFGLKPYSISKKVK